MLVSEFNAKLHESMLRYRLSIELAAGPAGLRAEICSASAVLALYLLAAQAGAEVNKLISLLVQEPVPDWRAHLAAKFEFPLPHATCTFHNLERFNGKALWLESIMQQSALVAAGYKGPNLIRQAHMLDYVYERS